MSKLKVLSVACAVVRLLAVAGCADEAGAVEVPDTSADGGASNDGDAGSPPSETEQDGGASEGDAALDRRISWDGGADGGPAIVQDAWTRGNVYCARVQRGQDVTTKCWGSNRSGELGRGVVSVFGTTYVPQPIQSPDAPHFTMVKADISARGVVCGLLDTNDLKCWGAGYALGSPVVPSVPETPFLQDVSAVEVGPSHACAIKTDGTLLCWSGNTNGQLGIGKQDSLVHPTPEEVPGITVEQVAVGPTGRVDHPKKLTGKCVVSKDDELLCCGSNGGGVLAESPVQLTSVSGAIKIDL